MTFLNKKEEVIDLVMTRKGRELYRDGAFKPAYYQFYDDEIIYDDKWAMGSGSFTTLGYLQSPRPGDPVTKSPEEQNKTVPRIKDTLILKNQNAWIESAEGLGHPRVGTNAHMPLPADATTSPLMHGYTKANDVKRKPRPLKFALAKSSPFSQKAPSWNVIMHEGNITGSVYHVPIEDLPLKDINLYSGERIPQINLVCDYTYNHFIWMKGNVDKPLNKDGTKKFPNIPKDHQHFIVLQKSSDDFFLEIVEENVEKDLDDNFIAEVYHYEYIKTDDTAKHTEQKCTIIDIDRQLDFVTKSEEKIDESFVEYYLDISTDKDAEENIQIKYVDDESMIPSGLVPEDECDDPCVTYNCKQ